MHLSKAWLHCVQGRSTRLMSMDAEMHLCQETVLVSENCFRMSHAGMCTAELTDSRSLAINGKVIMALTRCMHSSYTAS